jgi:DNA polymerase (family X)
LKEERTARIIRAVANPFTTILGHMTGRQLLRRPGYEEKFSPPVPSTASPSRSTPIRGGSIWIGWHQRALDLGCMMSINPTPIRLGNST